MAIQNPTLLMQVQPTVSTSPAWIIMILCSAVLISIGLFFIFRAVVLWYWKINRIVELLENIDIKLGHVVIQTGNKPSPVNKEKTT